MVARCPRCDYLFEREEGFFLGAFVINFAVTQLALGIVLAVLIALEASGGAPLDVIVAAAVAVAVLVPVVFYPFSKTIWAAIDFFMHGGHASSAIEQRAPRPGEPR